MTYQISLLLVIDSYDRCHMNTFFTDRIFGKTFFMQTKTGSINTEWHKKHPMPKNPTIQQRIDWHLEHLKNCNCRRNLPEKLKAEMKRLKIKIPLK